MPPPHDTSADPSSSAGTSRAPGERKILRLPPSSEDENSVAPGPVDHSMTSVRQLRKEEAKARKKILDDASAPSIYRANPAHFLLELGLLKELILAPRLRTPPRFLGLALERDENEERRHSSDRSRNEQFCHDQWDEPVQLLAPTFLWLRPAGADPAPHEDGHVEGEDPPAENADEEAPVLERGVRGGRGGPSPGACEETTGVEEDEEDPVLERLRARARESDLLLWRPLGGAATGDSSDEEYRCCKPVPRFLNSVRRVRVFELPLPEIRFLVADGVAESLHVTDDDGRPEHAHDCSHQDPGSDPPYLLPNYCSARLRGQCLQLADRARQRGDQFGYRDWRDFLVQGRRGAWFPCMLPWFSDGRFSLFRENTSIRFSHDDIASNISAKTWSQLLYAMLGHAPEAADEVFLVRKMVAEYSKAVGGHSDAGGRGDEPAGAPGEGGDREEDGVGGAAGTSTTTAIQDLRDGENEGLLHHAARRGIFESVEFLLGLEGIFGTVAWSADDLKVCLQLAMDRNHRRVAELLLARVGQMNGLGGAARQGGRDRGGQSNEGPAGVQTPGLQQEGRGRGALPTTSSPPPTSSAGDLRERLRRDRTTRTRVRYVYSCRSASCQDCPEKITLKSIGEGLWVCTEWESIPAL